MTKKTELWLVKTEPGTYSFRDLSCDGKTNWNGVRNFQARNFIAQISKGDIVLIYHSGDEKAVVGVAQVISEPYPDPDPDKKGEWLQFDLKHLYPLSKPVSLAAIKSTAALKTIPLVRQSRLSVMPISTQHFKTLLKLGGKA